MSPHTVTITARDGKSLIWQIGLNFIGCEKDSVTSKPSMSVSIPCGFVWRDKTIASCSHSAAYICIWCPPIFRMHTVGSFLIMMRDYVFTFFFFHLMDASVKMTLCNRPTIYPSPPSFISPYEFVCKKGDTNHMRRLYQRRSYLQSSPTECTYQVNLFFYEWMRLKQ